VKKHHNTPKKTLKKHHNSPKKTLSNHDHHKGTFLVEIITLLALN